MYLEISHICLSIIHFWYVVDMLLTDIDIPQSCSQLTACPNCLSPARASLEKKVKGRKLTLVLETRRRYPVVINSGWLVILRLLKVGYEFRFLAWKMIYI